MRFSLELVWAPSGDLADAGQSGEIGIGIPVLESTPPEALKGEAEPRGANQITDQGITDLVPDANEIVMERGGGLAPSTFRLWGSLCI